MLEKDKGAKVAEEEDDGKVKKKKGTTDKLDKTLQEKFNVSDTAQILMEAN